MIQESAPGSRNSANPASSQTATLTAVTCEGSAPQTSADMTSIISSAGLADGPMLSHSLAGPQTDLFGAPLSPANPGATPVNKREPMTVAISGQHSTGSYANSALSQLLVSKLRQRLDLDGSMEYRLTWKAKATPSGRLYYQLVASERRTDDIEFSGWPSVKASNTNVPSIHGNGGKDLQTVAMSAWVSPTAQDHSRGNQPARETDTGIPLSQQVASWRSPASQDSKWRATPNTNKARMESGKQVSLEMQAVEYLSTWGTPASRDHKDGHCDMTKVGENGLLHRQVLGAITTSATSQTVKSGGLNPALSRWLQSYPKEWCLCAIRAYRKYKTPAKRDRGVSTVTEIQ